MTSTERLSNNRFIVSNHCTVNFHEVEMTLSLLAQVLSCLSLSFHEWLLKQNANENTNANINLAVIPKKEKHTQSIINVQQQQQQLTCSMSALNEDDDKPFVRVSNTNALLKDLSSVKNYGFECDMRRSTCSPSSSSIESDENEVAVAIDVDVDDEGHDHHNYHETNLRWTDFHSDSNNKRFKADHYVIAMSDVEDDNEFQHRHHNHHALKNSRENMSVSDGDDWNDDDSITDIEYNEDDEEDGNDAGEIPLWYHDEYDHQPPWRPVILPANLTTTAKKELWDDNDVEMDKKNFLQSPFSLCPVGHDSYDHHGRDKKNDDEPEWPRIDLSWLDDDASDVDDEPGSGLMIGEQAY